MRMRTYQMNTLSANFSHNPGGSAIGFGIKCTTIASLLTNWQGTVLEHRARPSALIIRCKDISCQNNCDRMFAANELSTSTLIVPWMRNNAEQLRIFRILGSTY